MLRYGYVIFLFLFISCTNDNNKIPDTPTTGKIKVFADITFQYILPPQIELFSSIYKNADLTCQFDGESNCINALLNDSCKIILISRKLSPKELKVFENKNLIIQQTPLAHTGVAILGQEKEFRNKGITLDKLKNSLIGNEKHKIVFFQNSSGATLYCKDSLLDGQNFGKNCFSINDSGEFKKYILSHPDAIGIIDFTYICDNDYKWAKSVKYSDKDTFLIPIRKNKNLPAYYPDQSNIATGDYPLKRTIYCIRRGDNFSLSAGIEAFLAGEKGQILFKKTGLAPVIDRERKIEMKPF